MQSHSKINAAEISGRNIFDVYPDIKRRGKDKYILDCISQGQNALLSSVFHEYLIPLDILFGGKAQSMKQYVKINPIYEGGKVSMAVILIQDSTESFLYNQEIKNKAFELKEINKKLTAKSFSLEEVNTALKVLLKKRDEDKTELEEKILLNIRELIDPLLERLKESGLEESQIGYVNALEAFLKEIISPFSQTLRNQFKGLTPMEIRVANMIKAGRATKEIAGLLNSSTRAVEFHRHNLRAKLGLRNKKANLVTHLSSLS